MELPNTSVFIKIEKKSKGEITDAKTIEDLVLFTRVELYEYAKSLGLKKLSKSVKHEIIINICDFINMEKIEVEVVELTPKQIKLKETRSQNGKRLAEFNRLFNNIGSLFD